MVNQPKIIHQDQMILVVNKPSGLVVNRAKTVKGQTLQDWLERETSFLKTAEKGSPFCRRSGIVHRLDKDTSGVILVAKQASVFQALQKQFKQRKVAKAYQALVHGRLEPAKGNIKLPLARNPKNRKKFIVRLPGKMAVTDYQRQKVYRRLKPKGSKKQRFSLLTVQPKTGRTHQIRVHLKHIGYPIVADPIYLGQSRLETDQTWCPRLFLHARRLSFYHPGQSTRVSYQAALAADLAGVIENQLKPV